MRGLVFSSYMNAYAIYKGAHCLGVKLATTDNNPLHPIPSKAGSNKADWLFFTEEESLRRALNGEHKGKFLPSRFPARLLDNKWAFVEWLAAHDGLTPGLRQWPLSEIEHITYPCLCKSKHSWFESVNMPRGWICRSAEEAENCSRTLHEKGSESSHFFFQEWLGDAQCRVISVCGFHDCQDKSRNLTAVVERIASHTDGLSCSAAVETIEDDWHLVSRTAAILNALKFTGPFELEYLVSGDRVAVLELNPRFWMQHALFLVKGNGLLRRYLNMDNEKDRRQRSISEMVWFDGLHLLRSLASFRLDFLILFLRKFLSKQKKVIIWPSLPIAMYVWLRIIHNKAWLQLKKYL